MSQLALFVWDRRLHRMTEVALCSCRPRLGRATMSEGKQVMKKITFGSVSLVSDENHWLTLTVRYNDGPESMMFNPREAGDLLNAAIEFMNGEDDGS